MNTLRGLWSDVRSSLWFLPTLIVLGAILLALALVEIDTILERDQLQGWPRLFGLGAKGSRGMLEVIASSMITVAGVVFSITIVALSLASNQYSSRVLRNFMNDRTNQTVLGIFVGIFAYCLVVLRTIRGGDEGAFVPSLAVLAALALALVGSGYLIFFIHPIAASIQASQILAAIREETQRAIDSLFPQDLGEENEEAPSSIPQPERDSWFPLLARKTGYIQEGIADSLLAFARDYHAVLRMERGIGEFVIEGAPLGSLSRAREDSEAASRRLHDCFILNRQRTIDQDVGFGLRQLVDVALKALSPSSNDTTTAVMCVKHLTALLVCLGTRRIESPYRFEEASFASLPAVPISTNIWTRPSTKFDKMPPGTSPS